MGHQMETFIYPVTKDKKVIEDELNEYARKATWREGGHGLYNRIRWLGEKIYFGEDEADAAIDKADRNNYDQLAVKFWAPATETAQLWYKAYEELLKAYADVLKLRKSQQQIGARELLRQAEYRLHNAQVAFKELNKTSTLMWLVKIEYHI